VIRPKRFSKYAFAVIGLGLICFWGNCTLPENVFRIANHVNSLRTDSQHTNEILLPVCSHSICKEHGALKLENEGSAFIKLLLFGLQFDADASDVGIAGRYESDVADGLLRPSNAHTGQVVGEGHVGWIDDLKVDAQDRTIVGGRYFKGSPMLQVDPLFLGDLLERDTVLRRLRRSGGSPSSFRSGSGLPVDSADSEQSDQDAENREPKIGPVQRIVSGIIGISLLGLSVWLLYGDRPKALRGTLLGALLFVLCFSLSVPFVDTGFCGVSIWIRLLSRAYK